jgi:hypothetical protein
MILMTQIVSPGIRNERYLPSPESPAGLHADECEIPPFKAHFLGRLAEFGYPNIRDTYYAMNARILQLGAPSQVGSNPIPSDPPEQPRYDFHENAPFLI